jgi:hypothetical protein
MDFPRYSKSFDASYSMCPFYAHAKHVLKADQGERGAAATHGLDVEKVACDAIFGRIDLAEADLPQRVKDDAYGILAAFPYWDQRDLFHEQVALGLDARGDPVPFDEGRSVIKWDLVGVVDGVGVVIDIKTGRYRDSLMERTLYVAGLKALFPQIMRFEFIYLHPGQTYKTYYVYDSPRKVLVCDNPTGQGVVSFSSRGIDPLFKVVLDRIKELETDPLKVIPGAHCENMYGNPCPFLGTICPLAEFLPQVIGSDVPLSTVIASEVLALPPAEAPGAAFLALHRDYPVEMTPEIVSLAYQGVSQLRGGASQVAGKIRKWCEEGNVFSVGGQKYGMRPANEVDTELALRFGLARMDTADLAKVISISASKIKAISEKKYPGLKATLLREAVMKEGKSTFGVIE